MKKAFEVNIGDTTYKVVTISGLAQMCQRSADTFRKYTQREILPEANVRMPDRFIGGNPVKGDRIYTMELAIELAKIFRAEISQGIPITSETQTKINILFKNERQRLFPET